MSQQQLPAAVASLQSGDITVADFAAATSTAALTEAAAAVTLPVRSALTPDSGRASLPRRPVQHPQQPGPLFTKARAWRFGRERSPLKTLSSLDHSHSPPRHD